MHKKSLTDQMCTFQIRIALQRLCKTIHKQKIDEKTSEHIKEIEFIIKCTIKSFSLAGFCAFC